MSSPSSSDNIASTETSADEATCIHCKKVVKLGPNFQANKKKLLNKYRKLEKKSRGLFKIADDFQFAVTCNECKALRYQ